MTDGNAIRPLTSDEHAQIGRHLDWVRGHVDDAASLSDYAGMMDFLNRIVRADWIGDYGRNEFFVLGFAFGEALCLRHGWRWAMVSDEHGADFAVVAPDNPETGITDFVIFPAHMFAKRSDTPGDIDVYGLEDQILASYGQN